MALNPKQQQVVDLISKAGTTFLPYNYGDLEPELKTLLIQWLNDHNFPSDKPEDLVGEQCVLSWFDDNTKLFIFSLSYEEAEQCGGTIIFASNGSSYSLVTDTVKCSD